MDNFMIENGWQENTYFKLYICIKLYNMILACSMQSHMIPLKIYHGKMCFLKTTLQSPTTNFSTYSQHPMKKTFH
jgi:hypothetical protein